MKLQSNANSALIISNYPFQIQVNACSVFLLRHYRRTLFIKFIHSLFDTRTIWKPSSENATLFTVLERIPCGHSRPTVTVTSTSACLTGTWIMHKCGGAETKSRARAPRKGRGLTN